MLLDSFKEQRKETWIKNYGVDHPWKSEEVRKQIEKTCLEKYGVTNGGGSKQAQEKIKKTCLEHYGVENPMFSQVIKNKIKETCIKKYGVPCVLQDEGVKEKILKSQIKNKSFQKSKPEDEVYNVLTKKFNVVKRQYIDKRYAYINKFNKLTKFRCDFYIKDIDLFIEYNGYAAHGKHAYNPNSKEDNIQVSIWKEKYQNGKHPLYMKFIKGWTEHDVLKRNVAKENELNFMEFWNLDEFYNWINNYDDNKNY